MKCMDLGPESSLARLTGASTGEVSSSVHTLDHAARDAATRISARLRSEVVLASVNDHGLADDRVRSGEADRAVDPFVAGGAVGDGFEVAEVSGMAFRGGSIRGAVGRTAGRKVTAGGGCVGRAAVAGFVDVEAVQAGVESADLGDDADSVLDLDKRDPAAHIVPFGRFEHSDDARPLDHPAHAERCGGGVDGHFGGGGGEGVVALGRGGRVCTRGERDEREEKKESHGLEEREDRGHPYVTASSVPPCSAVPMLPEPHLTAEGLGKRFGRRVLFRDVAFDLGPGDSLAVTGANGAGKSTLLQVIAGVQSPTAGTVRLALDGAPLEDAERPLQIGFVAPYLQLYEPFSAIENLRFLARARRLSDAEVRIAAVLERVGLGTRGNDLVRTYSSGMRQRVRLAAALLATPSVLLFDEPTATLDAPGRAVVEAIADEHREQGGVLLVATNVEGEASLCDRRMDVGEAA